MIKIYIDPGHGGESIGAAYKGRKEQDDCLRLSLTVRDALLTQENVEVKMSRTTDVNPEIEDRCAEANAWGADYFLSIHRNAFLPNEATGVEVWIYSKCAKGGETYKMAERVLNEVCAATGLSNRGVKFGAPSYDDFGINRLTNMHSCLLETGFVDNDNDNAVFDKKFNALAEGIAKAVYEANVGKWVVVNTKAEDKASTSDNGYIYYVQAGAFKDRKKAEAESKRISKLTGINCFVGTKGDVDGDGKITAEDARKVTRLSVGL